MVSVVNEGRRIGETGRRLGHNVYDAFANLFKSPEAAIEANLERGIAREEARELAKQAALELREIRLANAAPIVESGGLAKGVKGLFRAGVWIVEQPIGLAMKPVRWTLGAGASAFSHFPKAAPVVAVLGTAVAGGTWFANRESKKLQQQGEAIQQMQMAQAMAAQPQYMNNPEASQAFVDARMAADREQGIGGGSKADALMAARSKQPAPEDASVAAL